MTASVTYAARSWASADRPARTWARTVTARTTPATTNATTPATANLAVRPGRRGGSMFLAVSTAPEPCMRLRGRPAFERSLRGAHRGRRLLVRMFERVVLGVDPGTRAVGLAVVAGSGGRPQVRWTTTVRTNAGA